MDCCSNNRSDSKAIKVEGQLCYCFNYTEEQFRSAISSGTDQKLVEEIKNKMKDPGCFCETSNPSGKCCLKDIYSFINSHSE